MYHEFRNPNRSGWKYTYTGKELLPFAKKCLANYYAAEKEARTKMSLLIKDMNRTQDDPEIARCRTAIEGNGSQREELMVFVHEFTRAPEREYNLALGDVVFFGMMMSPEDMLKQ
jgi:hypothetical protein